MQKIIQVLVLAIAFISGSKAREDALKAEVATRDTTIADLTTALANEDIDDAAREAALTAAEEAKTAAENSLAAINTQIADANVKAEELVTLINGSPEIPANVDPTTGELVPTGQDPQA